MATTSDYQVTGMTCGHCEAAVREEVSGIAGVTGIDVSAETGELTITSEQPLADAEVISAVEEAGYSAVPRQA
ncbi:copper chaperone [Kocuria soli]|uniref:Copper chaperone n=1 Tax=Kocuria soli TaxID=2485125 RepID=A0A3N3ZTR2_9MICC|nr:heavy-metal-associated domain-containing protein [Kocuria soli]ROZ63557.1 copper chaperone [Kocuria soli]